MGRVIERHISERTDRGVPKITEAYGRETYEFRENSIVVSIPFTRVSTEESTPVTTPVSTPVASLVESLFEDNAQTKRILEFCTSPKGILEIVDMLGYTQKKSVRKYLKPLVEQGRLAMTIPERPNSSSQKYVTVR